MWLREQRFELLQRNPLYKYLLLLLSFQLYYKTSGYLFLLFNSKSIGEYQMV